MKIPYSLLKIKFIFCSLLIFGLISSFNKNQAQGFNNNEWIFGCGEESPAKAISFGKGTSPSIRNLNDILGNDNVAVAIDPISGNVIFYTDGVLLYNNLERPMQNMAPQLAGDWDAQQGVAIGILDYDVDGDKLYYTFYVNDAGTLFYSIVDMNDPGGATGSQPPLGAITEKDIQITTGVTGPILVVRPAETTFLLTIEGGNLVARGFTDVAGEFEDPITTPLPFAVRSMYFDEESGELVLIPEDPNEDIHILTIEPDGSSLGELITIEGTGNGTPINGVEFSPDGEYMYFSRGNELIRISTTDPDLPAQTIPLQTEIEEIYDIRVGPDGRLYYLYSEPGLDAIYVGVVENPNEEDILEVTVDEDPFDQADFCSTTFPNFSPNAELDPVVDFTWQPEQPCQNNPIQLTSEITPRNFRPVSFEWELSAELVDADGEPIELDLDQEHLLIPADATAEESVTVTLTVTFADGSTMDVTNTITLNENPIEAQFTPQDTTICAGQCFDIDTWLEASMGDDQQGGRGIGGPGGGGMDNLEYFWSDRKEEGWGPKERPCITDKPGLYWVLVRDPMNPEGCTAYASIRVNVWDIDDPKNNIWYFGDGAGLDFNPDPDDPDGPIPRPIPSRHPSNMPAGVTTISDAAGEVLFYSDGSTVWNATGDVLAENIGGDPNVGQSILAVAVPQDETLYYLFTIGNGEAKFSTVDLKGSPPTGVGFGSVPTQDNFLFSTSTEKMAAAGSSPTWVLFHEAGNNTFRAYPVGPQGIGQPVFSAVGQNHNFNSGEIGAMKFSPDGSQVAITFSDGTNNWVEIFDFDSETGELSEYASIDLGGDGEVYGVEFSGDGSRIYVSYLGGNSRVEEFIIEPIEGCFECLDNANTKGERESCIVDTRMEVTSEGDFGALQIGPDGQVYVARPGQSVIGQIQTLEISDEDCTTRHFYNTQAHDPMPGTSNLGLPAFVNMDGSAIPEPALDGPEQLCLDPEEGAWGLFEGGGEPDIDTYFWTIRNEDGDIIHEEEGGEEAQNLEYEFPTDGTFTVELRVDRCGDPTYFEDEMEVVVIAPPTLILEDEAVLCAGDEIELTAMDEEADGFNEEDYIFEWVNAAGEILGTTNTITVNEESIYTVRVRHRIPEGTPDAEILSCPNTQSIFVGPAFQFEVEQSDEEVCVGEIVTFEPDTPIEGEWFYQLEGEEDRIRLQTSETLELDTEILGAGQFDIIFVAEDPLVEDCMIEKRNPLLVNPLPDYTIEVLDIEVDCDNPEGVIVLTVNSPIESLVIEELDLSFENLEPGQVEQIENLAPRNYTFLASNNSCEFTRTARIDNISPPANYEYDLDLEADCDNQLGSITVTFSSIPVTASYELVREGSGETWTGEFSEGLPNTIENLPSGQYAFQIITPDGCPIPHPDPIIIDFRTIPAELVPESFCGNEGNTITVTGNFREGMSFEWYLDNVPLSSGPETTIAAEDGGVYLVEILNEFGCVVGEDRVTILDSNIQSPTLDDRYVICAIENFAPEIFAGNYERFEWVFEDEDEPFSDMPSILPDRPGEYTLRVWDEEGCMSMTTFMVEEDCEPRVITPNAMNLRDPNKWFVVYVNEFVNEVQLLIYNRWGELIHVVEQVDTPPRVPILEWDGTVRGQTVPIGTYPVIIRFKSVRQNLEKEIKTAVVVLE
ncbi:gliding motility-associated C-terminal domain-containing protein [Litoribacter ruber]|uniref:T9SS type B sorting domain-containing protein n=1 Tax=Litoribacter ruber TaxID=702568 RepID=UPI001BDA1B1A|nr:gliding motility-associated C-terminal domain-containing protein [Litoribacter ruber]MBT0811468.1 gliding motility-associated C-terminal domain-containing protein [Litoribacter ruber]